MQILPAPPTPTQKHIQIRISVKLKNTHHKHMCVQNLRTHLNFTPAKHLLQKA